MKKIYALLVILVLSSTLFADRIGFNIVTDPMNPEKASSAKPDTDIYAYLTLEIQKGNFVLKNSQRDGLADVEHKRFQQVYNGLSVWGGEIIQHARNGEVLSYDGEYFEISQVDVNPKIASSQALESIQAYYKDSTLEENSRKTELVIFPVDGKEFRLAYKMVVKKPEKPMFNETVLVDAESGNVLFHYPNIWTENLTIGSGQGQRGDTLKFPTTLDADKKYYMWDSAAVRPVVQGTYDAKHSYGGNLSPSNTTANTWSSDNVVNVHTYIGYAYDYYFKQFGLHGLDNKNLPLKSFAHIFSVYWGLTDNAFWNPSPDDMYGTGFYFLDPYYSNLDFGAAIDVICHEYSHGVTQYHANLYYYSESGALNESFSDIMGTAIEFYFQAEGQGYNKADWYTMEDANSPFSYNHARCLSDPNSIIAVSTTTTSYPYPCHISQKIPTLYYQDGSVYDNDGVHVNCTIYSHAFYLLAHGGTNKVSHLAVTGIGLEKAARIFYDAWVNRMNGSTNFLGAANALLASAYYLYGSTSAEYAQMKNTIRAIGYTVN